MISKEEVKHIAKLARLGLEEKEIAKHQKEFLKILDYIEKLKQVDVCRYQIPPSTQAERKRDEASQVKTKFSPSLAVPDTARLKIMRKDEVLNDDEKLIDGHIKVKPIL